MSPEKLVTSCSAHSSCFCPSANVSCKDSAVAGDVYNANKSDLVVMQSFQHGAEQFENSGMNCVVSRKAVTMSTPSNITRGRTKNHKQNIVVKRIHEGVVAPGSRALKSFIAE